MTIDWATPLAAIDGDNSQIAFRIRDRVRGIGVVYNFEMGIESADHAAWRADTASQLAARDKAAASVDGLPLTTIDPANPTASALSIMKRMISASRLASGGTRDLLFAMMGTVLLSEPFPTVTYPIPNGDFTGALNAALAQLAAYVAVR